MRNDELLALLSTLRMDQLLRIRLQKLFRQSDPVMSLNFLGHELGKRLNIRNSDLDNLLIIARHIPSLQSLTLIGLELDDESMGKIAEVFPHLTSLKTFYINSNVMSVVGIQHIVASLDRLPSLRNVHLLGDSLDDQAIRIAAQSVMRNTNITSFSFIGKNLGVEAIMAICDLMSANQLEQLWFACQQISSDACESLSIVISHNRSLKALSIEANDIANPSVILDAIRYNYSVVDFEIVCSGDSEKQV